MQRFRVFHDHVISDAAQSAAEHRAILAAFRSRSAVDAAGAMRGHLENLLARVGRPDSG